MLAKETTIALSVRSTGVDESRMQALTRDLARALRDERVGKVARAEHDATHGKKGDPVTIGEIVLTLIGSGGAVMSLLQILRAFIERQKSLVFEISRNDKKLTLNATNLSQKELRSTSALLEDLMKT